MQHLNGLRDQPRFRARHKLLFTLVLCALLISLVACNAAGTPETSAPAPSKVLVLAHNQNRKVIVDSIQDSANRFMADHPDYEVRIERYINEAYKKKLASAAATGNLPDVFATWGGETLNEYARLGMVVDLAGMMAENQDTERFLPASMTRVTSSGGTWGVPVDNIALALVFYNKDIFAQHSIRVPQTWSELLEVVTTLKSKGIIPFALANRSGWPGSMYYMYLVDRLAGPTLFANASNRSLPDGFAAPEFVTAWEHVVELSELGAFPDNVNTLDEDVGDSKQLLYDGQAAMSLNGSWLISDIYDEQPDFLQKVDFFTFPAIPGGKGDVDNLVGTVGDQYYSVSAGSEDPEMAYALIRYLIDDQAVEQRLSAYVIPPLKGIQPQDPLLKRISLLAETAPSIQFWYDQSLSPRLAEEHKQICRDVLEGLDPVSAATQMEQAAHLYATGH